jgi:co-chaperonin GroES (HSP10)
VTNEATSQDCSGQRGALAAQTPGETNKPDREQRMKLEFGQYVRHGKYGWGTIVELDGNRTMVYFRTLA